FKMNEGLENNSTHLYDNWTLSNSSVEYVTPRKNITYVGYYLHLPSTAAIFIVSYMLIFVVCMVGNGVVCFIVLRSRNMRTVTNLFILNLAVSDLLVGIFCMPTTLLDNIITERMIRLFIEMKQQRSLFWGCPHSCPQPGSTRAVSSLPECLLAP
ncbi:Neuropeptide FF receptor 2, partial [Goodea atripinnis]